ncbi:nuclear transport factor 2 family protein [Candidatus Poriferisodalis sp.]|uniref:nuclear transport factor 2 family protein n=1 Tax=Candidatus Poriferisodalis sp. TaxID=3101277 RepID=UPI003AF68FDB
MSSSDIEARLQRLEDIEAIKQLKARYCAYCDDDYDADGIAGLYTEDGTWDGSPSFPSLNGREEIREFFKGAAEIMTLARHQVMNPIIEVEGDEANGQWLLFQPCTDANAGAVWLAATYLDGYRRVGDDWKIAATRIEVSFFSPYEKGWEAERFVGES